MWDTIITDNLDIEEKWLFNNEWISQQKVDTKKEFIETLVQFYEMHPLE